MKSSTFDVGVGLSGVSFTVSIGDGKVEQSQDQHNSGTYQATNISIKVNNKLEIENAQINGINVKVEALIIEIKQVVDSSVSKGQSTGVSMGVNIGWGGGVTPILSVSNSESLQQSQVVQFISGISGETVEVIAARKSRMESPEFKAKISGANHHNAKIIERYDLITNEVLETYHGGNQLLKQQNFDSRSVYECCNNKRAKYKGFGWRYVT